MIKAKDAIAQARGLLGTPYAQLDCINLIKKVIRDAPGGVKSYTTAGSNALWRSFDSTPKYKDLTWRQEGLSAAAETSSVSPSAIHLPQEGRLDAKAGMLAFKADGEDYRHVGIVTGEGTVIHSSSTQGGRGVVETPLTRAEGWTHLAVHRHIETQKTSSVSSGGAATFPKGEGISAEEREAGSVENYKAIVKLNDPSSTLNVRNEPGKGGDIINKLLNGQRVTVQAAFENGWVFVAYGDSGKSGYVSGEYIVHDDTPEEADLPENVLYVSGTPVIVDGNGNEFFPIGGWHVEFRKED